MLTLITNARTFAPQPLGTVQVLIAGDRIAAVDERVDLSGSELRIVDADNGIVVPGIVDALTHPCGGGGEGGFQNRTPEIDFAGFVNAGVTSPIGALGTDSVARSLDVLYGHVMSLRAQGLGAYMYTGSYRIAPTTLTGDIARDITHIDPVIGVGEIAISDHRSSQPTIDELRRTAADCRLGGIIAGTGGTTLVHVGDGGSRLAPLRAALEGCDLPAGCFYPTHVNRNRELLDEAIEFSNRGASIDITVSTVPEFVELGEVPALQALADVLEAGVSPDRVTFSSDAGGSLPVYRNGELQGLTAAPPTALLKLLQQVLRTQPDLATFVIAAMTCNPAAALNIASKGRIAPGRDADLLVLRSDSFALSDVFCRGRCLMRNGNINIHSTDGG
ncbi:MAG: beta-aspartyl-peptidase [Woeseiaceae bacterium]|nr:beta-aspartyl-peptidase [Woeseiaceae bacterium]